MAIPDTPPRPGPIALTRPVPSPAEFSDLPHGSWVVFESSMVSVGVVRCPSDHPHFEDPGPVGQHTVYFPHGTVLVEREGLPPLLADPGIVTAYNVGDIVRRSSSTNQGDHSEYFAPNRDVLLQILQDHDPQIEDSDGPLFPFTHVPVDRGTFLRQRLLTQELLLGERDPLFVEEACLEILSRIVATGMQLRGSSDPEKPQLAERRRQLAQAARELVGEQLGEPLQLADIADRLGCSEFHLARVFRQVMGTSIHAYRNQLRLQNALDRVTDSREGLTQIAFDLGYSSHSHFTTAFRKLFGTTPSELRKGCTPRQLRRLRNRALCQP